MAIGAVRNGAAISEENPASLYSISKRGFDVAVSIVLLPLVLVFGVIILAVNPFLNPGTLFFTQTRMGRDGRAFRIVKFRTMLHCRVSRREAHDPLEEHRITPFGAFLRRTRIDETPQVLNILFGDMSLVGPRPDMYEHAEHFVATVPLYRRRLAVRPGITGFAQVTSGYAAGMDATLEKARQDAVYVRRMNWSFDLRIIWRTVLVIVTGHGSR